MLSNEQEIKACYRRKERPLLVAPINVRVRFQKIGDLQYISHLDLQRTFHRILVRAGIPMWYTKGFNPHAKLVFSTPLSVGAQSTCEMLDIRIDREISCEEIKELLNREVTDELRILDVYVPDTKFSDIVWATYEICINEEGIANQVKEIRTVLEQESLTALKKTKSGEREINIRPLIRSFSIKEESEGNRILIKTMLSIGSDKYLNPELLLSVLKEKTGILLSAESWYTVMRTETFFEDGCTVFH